MALPAADAICLRPLRADDHAHVVAQREAMFREAGRHEAEAISRMSAAFAPWLAPRLADGRYFGWLAEQRGAVVAGLGMMWLDWPPHPLHVEPGRGYLLNLWVTPRSAAAASPASWSNAASLTPASTASLPSCCTPRRRRKPFTARWASGSATR